ncbi:MAG: hypothetical protein CR982_01910 [Candidatus Cloacimonadota bacterium]|nr:MAG: hypothetical protein CR982_01910 [Candidatus Cloacimonadota bacterium]PIE78897.1 MAG: hypothetical protein CSA15_05445 [Candidatus Delongbacteria bacterium]
MDKDIVVIPTWVSYREIGNVYYISNSSLDKEYKFEGSSYIIWSYIVKFELASLENLISYLLLKLEKEVINFDYMKINQEVNDFVQLLRKENLIKLAN